MVGEHSNKTAERAWKHRFAQTLYEVLCSDGVDQATALADAYVHADAQYLGRGLGTPEAEALSVLTRMQSDVAQAAVSRFGEGTQSVNPPDRVHRVRSQLLFLGPDLTE